MDLMDLARATAALVLTLGILAGLAWLARRFGLFQGGAPGLPGALRRLKVVEQLWLDQGRSRLMIIACDGREHIVLVSPSGAARIAETAAPAAGAVAPASGPAYAPGAAPSPQETRP